MAVRHYQPTKIIFGTGELASLGALVRPYGKKCLLVTSAPEPALTPLFERAEKILRDTGMEVTLFQHIRPNPLTTNAEEGVQTAFSCNADVIVAVGGGSVIDTAKIIAFFGREGRADWAYLKAAGGDFREQSDVREGVIPLIAVPTTSGTGSQCTQAAVISDAVTNEKTTFFRQEFFPLAALIDPELMLTLPPRMTACTGFDAFCHLSESYINGSFSPLARALAVEGMKYAAEALVQLAKENQLTYREKMAWADTMGGICLSNGGATIPHFLGEMVTGIVPQINHGASLALVYPAYLEEFFDDDLAGPGIRRILAFIGEEGNQPGNGFQAKETMRRFLKKIGLDIRYSDFHASPEQTEQLRQMICGQKRFECTARIMRIAEAFLGE